MNKTIDILEANRCDAAFVWKREAKEHVENWAWMKYSMQIALNVRRRMKELNMTQAVLAGRLGHTQQYVSLLLKGRENLTLETISKLEISLDLQLFPAPSFSVDGYKTQNNHCVYLSDVNTNEYGGK